MIFIGVDLGDKRVGLATSFGGVSMPYKTVERVRVIQEIKKIINEKKEISGIVVGLPFDLYGTDNRQLDKTKKFIEKLYNIFPDIKIYEQDERYTSFGADQVMKQTKSKNRKDDRDKIAASLILESFLDKNKF